MNSAGLIVEGAIRAVQNRFSEIEVVAFAIMPDHIHLLLNNVRSEVNLSTIIGSFKRNVTKKLRHENPNLEVWQVSFHDGIVRNQEELEKINAYIELNPENWMEAHEISSELF